MSSFLNAVQQWLMAAVMQIDQTIFESLSVLVGCVLGSLLTCTLLAARPKWLTRFIDHEYQKFPRGWFNETIPATGKLLILTIGAIMGIQQALPAIAAMQPGDADVLGDYGVLVAIQFIVFHALTFMMVVGWFCYACLVSHIFEVYERHLATASWSQAPKQPHPSPTSSPKGDAPCPH